MKIGLVRESKIPPDRRVAFPPDKAAELLVRYPEIELIVQPSEIRCYTDDEYREKGIVVQEDLSECDLLIGIKEVAIESLIPEKKYLFFAHVAKKQDYNRGLLNALLEKKNTLLDYEYFTDLYGARLIAFGRWAGIIGAYNALRAWGLRTGRFKLKPAHLCHDRKEMDKQLESIDLGVIRILVSGGGRVARGAMETLQKIGLPIVNPAEYLHADPGLSMVTRLEPSDYAARNDGEDFDLSHFFSNPSLYHSLFYPYARTTDLFISAHYWDPSSPRMWELCQMKQTDFRIRVIADISCDIQGSVPCTLRATTISDPFYGFDPVEEKEVMPFGDPDTITMMTIDNLPGELPRDASTAFSQILLDEIIPCLLGDDPSGILKRATIVDHGELTSKFSYLENFARGEE